MTTLITVSTRDALIMGCDSLGSWSKKLVDPLDLMEYFDEDDNYKIKVGADGKPILENLKEIFKKSQEVPYNHMTHVDKLFSLYPPYPVGIMAAGLASIGDRTVKNLIGEFKSTSYFKQPSRNYTVTSIGKRLLKFIWKYYEGEYPEQRIRPELEMMLGGYDAGRRTPGVIRVYVHKNKLEKVDYDFGVFLGGQMAEIQRLAKGIDIENKYRLIERHLNILGLYHKKLSKQLKEEGIDLKLKKAGEFGEELWLFGDGFKLVGLKANWGAFSEQNAIELVDFLVNLLIKSQQFGEQMPTVGGEVNIAVIKKDSGFHWVSKREWIHEGYAVPMED